MTNCIRGATDNGYDDDSIQKRISGQDIPGNSSKRQVSSFDEPDNDQPTLASDLIQANVSNILLLENILEPSL